MGFLAVSAAVAVVVVIGSLLDDSLRKWWWLVASVGVGAGLFDFVTSNRHSAHYRLDPATNPASRPDGPTPSSDVGVIGRVPVESGGAEVPDIERRPDEGSAAAASRKDALVVQEMPTVRTAVVPGAAPCVIRQAGTSEAAVWRSSALWFPKSSHDETDHEDAWAIDDKAGRAALADGASSAFMARQWALAVTSQFLDDPPLLDQGGFTQWVGRATERWAMTAAEGRDSSSWWAAASEKRGSYATLIGVSLDSERSNGCIGFTALAVGDSCLVHLTPDGATWKRALAFPLERPEDFGKHPELVATTGARSDGSMPVLRSASGQLRPGDALMLMSDAVAQFALDIDTGGDDSIWSWLMTTDQDRFTETISIARSAERIEDDDSTVVRILF